MIRTQLYLPDSQYKELKQIAAAQEKTFAAVIREMIDDGLQTTRRKDVKKKPGSAVKELLKSLKKIEQWKEEGFVRKGSTEVDDYLYGKRRFPHEHLR